MKKKKRAVKNPWFRKRRGLFSPDLGYGWIPISWQGWVLILIVIALNVFSVFYFGLPSGKSGSVLSFLTVLALSMVIFALIAKRRTKR